MTNTGGSALNVPYTVSISNPSYATIAGSAWNWGASGAANNGVISGPLTAVSINLAMPLLSTIAPLQHTMHHHALKPWGVRASIRMADDRDANICAVNRDPNTDMKLC